MGRRRVRTAPHSDGTVEQPAGVTSSTPSSAAGNSNGLQGSGSSAAAAAADKGDAPREGKNPLMGLLHYGSDSDEEGASAESAPAQQDSATSAAAADANPPPASDPAVAGEVTYALPEGWQQCMDNAGLVYFWNTETGITAWDPPEGTEIRRLAPSPAAAATATATAAAAAAAPVGVSPKPSAASSPAAIGAAGGSEQAGSDATSDTASEAEDDRAETIGTAAVEQEEGEEAGGDEKRRKSTSGTEKSAQFTRGSRAGADLDGDGGAKAEGGLSGSKGEVPQQEPAVVDGAAGEGSALGIDELLADIEAELLCGGGERKDVGNKDNLKSGGGGGGRDTTGSKRGGQKEEDFSPLRLLAPGLDARAQKAHAEVIAFLATAAAEKGVGSGSISEGTGMEKLGIELSAVLRCRLSDWREGGLDGTFLVTKLEDMASQARAVLDPSSTSSSQTPGVAAPGPADATSTTASVVGDSTAASGSSSNSSSGSSSSLSLPVPMGNSDAVESQPAAAAAAAAAAAVAEEKPKGRSKKRRRGAGGGGDATAFSEAAEGARGAVGTDPERKVIGDVIIRKPEGAKVTPAGAAGGGVDADAGANGGGGGGAELSRAERNAQQLKWADEVSAAASAAVAAAAALSQAKKEQAKAQAKAKAKQKQKEKRREKERQKQKERGGADLRGVDDSQGSKGVPEGEGRGDASSASGSGVEGTIDLGGVGDGEEREDGAEDGEVKPFGSAAAQSESKTAGVTSSQAVDEAETGIVIAKEAPPAELPSGWAAVFDTKNQAFYYHNLATDETTWVLPVDPTARVPDVDETVPEPSPKSSPQLDNPSVKADKRSDADGRSSSGRGGDEGGSSDPAAKSSKHSQRRKSPGEDGSGGLMDVSDAAAGSKVLRKATEKQTGVDEGPEKQDQPEDAQSAAVAAGEKEDDSSGATESLPSPWVAVWDDTQKAFYYHNTATDETSWEVPAAPDPAVPAVATAAAAADGSTPAASPSASSSSSSKKQNQHKKKKKASSADAAVVLASAAARHSSPPPDAAGSEADPSDPAVSGGTSAAEARRRSPSPVTPATAASALATEPITAELEESAPAAAAAPAAAVVDLRPSTLVWWSDAGDVWNGVALSGLLGGYGPRRYRNLGGGYYMTTLELGAEWATAAVAALGQGAADPVAAARVDWVSCTASAPGYGLFLRFSGDDDELKLFDVPDEYFDDPPPDPAAVAALAEAEAAAENAEMEAAAAAAVAATEEAEAAGSEAAASLATATTEAAIEKANTVAAAATAAATASATKKRKSKGGSGKSGGGVGSIGKKRKGAADLLAKWRAVASTAGEEAEKEAEKQAKMERWKAQAAAQDPNNSNFTPIGKKRR